MKTEELQSHLAKFSRLSLGSYPTLLEPMPRLSAQLGHPLFIKRDDLVGPGLGGNKTRKLEFLLADAQNRKAKKVVTFGGLQSNHARLTAAAANRLGMQTHLFYFEHKPAVFRGNLLINQILQAKMHFLPFGSGSNQISIETTIGLVRLIAFLTVGSHYFIPVGGHSFLGCLGYVQAAIEIEHQAQLSGIPNAWLVVAAGTGGTLAGLLAGLSMIGSNIRPLGIDVGKLWKGFPVSTAHLARKICSLLGESMDFPVEDLPLIEGKYVGPGYGQASQECLSALQILAQKEGILLDPIYTGKAFAGLFDLVKKGYFSPGDPIIFLHTGGLPTLFTIGNLQSLDG